MWIKKGADGIGSTPKNKVRNGKLVGCRFTAHTYFIPAIFGGSRFATDRCHVAICFCLRSVWFTC